MYCVKAIDYILESLRRSGKTKKKKKGRNMQASMLNLAGMEYVKI